MKTLPLDSSESCTAFDNVGRLMADVAAKLERTLDLRAKAFGISGPQWIVLMRISCGDSETAASLCRAIHYDSGSMTRMLDRLVALGLIERERKHDDRRVINLRLTQKGLDLLAKVSPIGSDIIKQYLSGFTDDEVQTLIVLLSRILQARADEP